MEIVIIGHNEGNFIIRMCSSLKHIDVKKIWVLDRCTDYSRELLTECGQFYVETNPNLTGRRVSSVRNLGLSYCSKDSDVLFLDGDRFVTEGSLLDLEQWDKDIALLMLERDIRDDHKCEYSYGSVHNGFFSCGVFLKRSAINKILEFQNGELFREDIQDIWGIEDVYLGDVCYHLKLSCEIYQGCRLHGEFSDLQPGLEILKRRFILRENLDVLWD